MTKLNLENWNSLKIKHLKTRKKPIIKIIDIN